MLLFSCSLLFALQAENRAAMRDVFLKRFFTVKFRFLQGIQNCSIRLAVPLTTVNVNVNVNVITERCLWYRPHCRSKLELLPTHHGDLDYRCLCVWMSLVHVVTAWLFRHLRTLTSLMHRYTVLLPKHLSIVDVFNTAVNASICSHPVANANFLVTLIPC